jgi:hypothetical protein
VGYCINGLEVVGRKEGKERGKVGGVDGRKDKKAW